MRKILGGLQKMPSFLLCAGDDRTDEDMFRVLDDYILENSPSQDASWCYTCIVGNASRRTNARYRVQSSEHLVTVLSQLAIS